MSSQAQQGGQDGGANRDDLATTDQMLKDHGLHPLMVPDLFPHPGFNNTGKEVLLKVNTYLVTQYPTKKVYQYEVNSFPTQRPDYFSFRST
jgi:hypothetical protein